MSRWRPETLTLTLGAAGLPAGLQPAAEALLAALQGALAARQPTPAKGTRLQLRLPDAALRWALLAWHPEAATAARRMLFARHALRQLHGDAAEAWDLTCDAPAPGQSALVVAMAPGLLPALQTLASAHGLRLAGVQPALMAAFNEARSALPAQGLAWFVLQGDAGCTLLLLEDGAPRHVRLLPQVPAALAPVLAQEALWLGLDAARVPVVERQVRPDVALAGSPATRPLQAEVPA